MTIQLNCGCGRRYQIGDEHAGKKTKCKACGAVHVIPNPEPEEVFVGVVEDDTEVVDAIEIDDDETEVMPAIEVEEDEKRPPARRPPRRDPDDDGDNKRGGKKQRRPSGDDGGPLSRQYMAEARESMRRDELRATGGRREDDDQSWTIGGLHITAGVISGAVLILIGLTCIVFIAIFKDDEDIVIGPRIFIGAIVCTVLGIGTLVKSLFFGEEE